MNAFFLDANQTFATKALMLSSNGIVLLDGNEQIIFWNLWMTTHSGISAKEAEGKTLEQAFHQPLPSSLQQAVTQRCKHHRGPATFDPHERAGLELFQAGKSGTPLAHKIRITSLSAAPYENLCLIEVIDHREVAQREQILRSQSEDLRALSQRIQEQSAYAHALVEQASDAHIIVDPEGEVRDLNPAAKTLLGLHEEPCIGRPVSTWFPEFSQCLENLSETPTEQMFETHGQRADGSDFTAQINTSLFSVKQQPYRLLVINELTEVNHIRDCLAQAREFAQTTLESIQEAIITTDHEGYITVVNSAALQLLKKEQHELLGRPATSVFDFSTIDSRQDLRKAMQATLEHGSTYEFNEDNAPELRYPDGARVLIAGNISPLLKKDEGIIGSLVIMRDITLHQRMNDILLYQATHDELTSLINRREFERQISEELQAETQNNVLLDIDLDQFKLINDACGHVAGDQLLKQLAGLLRSHLRNSDIMCRHGGDEFAVLLKECDLNIGHRIATNIRNAVRDYRFNWNGRVFAVTASIGVVAIDEDINTLSELFAAADSACYIAKENGRDQVVIYRAKGETEQRHRSLMDQAARIRESLERDRFTLYCQPIVAVDNQHNDEWGIEVLVRMFDENQQLVSPFAFIPAAERYNLMSHIDRWVITTLCQYWTTHPQTFERLDKVAINLSGQSFANEEFLSHLVDTVDHHKVPWKKLCFEITETAAVSSIEQTSHFMSQLKKKGCRFALDDFGTGMSSFEYLKNLPVDILKIDGVFVRDMLSDEIDAAMVRSISDIGQAMGLETVAEFVEDQQVLRSLRAAGVDWAQGYGICRPIPLSELDSFSPEPSSLRLSA